MAIKISAQELAQLGEPSIAFKDGSGYLAEMAVFHELHCIVRPKSITFRDECESDTGHRSAFAIIFTWTITTAT
jgi:hypothetical protein